MTSGVWRSSPGCAVACLLMQWLSMIPAWGAASEPPVNRSDRALLDGIEIEYEVRGTGEPVVFVHAGIFADWFAPLLEQPALAHHRTVNYYRVGYAGSSHVSGPVSITQQAAHLRSLLHELKIERAHFVGHSSGGLIVLQLALDAPPGMVHTLSLLEPALPLPTPATRGPGRPAVQSAIDLYHAGEVAAAVDTFMRAVAGPNYRRTVDEVLPHAFAQAVADADTFFEQELPAVQQWSFSRADAKRIRQPVLAVLGARSDSVSPIWQQRQNLLTTWLPNVQPFVLPNATHLLHLQQPRELAERLATFLAEHAMRNSATKE